MTARLAGAFGPIDRAETTAHEVRKLLAGPARRGVNETELRTASGAVFGVATGADGSLAADDSILCAVLGRITNTDELRVRLNGDGEAIADDRDATPAEFVRRLYTRFGADFVDFMRGAFALTVFDIRRRTLLLVRDRIGHGALFWARHDETVYVASELRSFPGLESMDLTIDAHAIQDFFAYRFVPAPATVFREVRSVPAAHLIRIRGGAVDAWPYWRPALGDGDASDDVVQEIVATVGTETKRAVAAGARLVETGSLGDALLADIAAVATTPAVAGSAAVDLEGGLIRLADRLDEPLGDPHLLHVFHLLGEIKATSRHAVAGWGSEAILGHPRRRFPRTSAFVDRPAGIRPLAHVARRLRATRLGGGRNLFGLAGDLGDAFLGDLEATPSSLERSLFRPEFRRVLGDRRRRDQFASYATTDESFAVGLFRFEIECRLGNDLLARGRCGADAHGMTLHLPIVDERVVDLVARNVSIFDAAAGDPLTRLTAPDRRHRSTRTSGPDLDTWLVSSLERLVNDVVLDQPRAVHFVARSDAIRRLVDDHSRRRRGAAAPLYLLLLFELWCRRLGPRVRWPF